MPNNEEKWKQLEFKREARSTVSIAVMAARFSLEIPSTRKARSASTSILVCIHLGGVYR